MPLPFRIAAGRAFITPSLTTASLSSLRGGTLATPAIRRTVATSLRSAIIFAPGDLTLIPLLLTVRAAASAGFHSTLSFSRLIASLLQIPHLLLF